MDSFMVGNRSYGTAVVHSCVKQAMETEGQFITKNCSVQNFVPCKLRSLAPDLQGSMLFSSFFGAFEAQVEFFRQGTGVRLKIGIIIIVSNKEMKIHV
jgi:hypothetical protein